MKDDDIIPIVHNRALKMFNVASQKSNIYNEFRICMDYVHVRGVAGNFHLTFIIFYLTIHGSQSSYPLSNMPLLVEQNQRFVRGNRRRTLKRNNVREE
jgi:hypothetical protein